MYVYVVSYMIQQGAKLCCCPKQELSCVRNHDYHSNTVYRCFFPDFSGRLGYAHVDLSRE